MPWVKENLDKIIWAMILVPGAPGPGGRLEGPAQDDRPGQQLKASMTSAPPSSKSCRATCRRTAPATPASPTCTASNRAGPGPHVLVNALTHGNEFCGMAAATHLLEATCARASAR